MSNPLKAYSAARETLLTEIIETLSGDDRFVAAWLTGSVGRNDADAVSDGERILNLMPEVAKMGGYVSSSPMPTIETLLKLADRE